MSYPYSHYTTLYIPFSGTSGDTSAAINVPLGLTATNLYLHSFPPHFSHTSGHITGNLNLPVSGSYSYFPVETGDFVIEFFYNPQGLSEYVQLFQAGSLTIAYDVGIKLTTPGYTLYNSIPTPPSTFKYITVSRTSGTLRLWVDGVYIGNHADTINYSTQYPVISTFNSSTSDTFAISELRLTSGSNRGFGSNSNITVPTASFGESFYNTGSPGYSFGRGGLTVSLERVVTRTMPLTISSSFTTISDYVAQAGGELLERIRVNDSIGYNGIMNTVLYDYLVGKGVLDSNSIGNEEIKSNLTLNDLLGVLYPLLLSETISIGETLSSIYKKIESVFESLKIQDSSNSLGTFYKRVVDLVSFLDSPFIFKRNIINESITINETIDKLWLLVSKINETLLLSQIVSNKGVVLIPLTDSFLTNSSLSSLGSFTSSLKEGFTFTLASGKGQDTYLAYLLSPETMYVSNYDNYNFDGCCKYKGDYYFYNSTGLYKYGSTLDDGNKITSTIETIAFSFKSSNLKQVPAIYLGWTSTGATYLKVRLDGKQEAHYKLNKKTGNLHTQKIGLGKGLISRYFQFELVSDADDFSIESIDFYPVELRRKL